MRFKRAAARLVLPLLAMCLTMTQPAADAAVPGLAHEVYMTGQMSINDHEDLGTDEHGSFRITGNTRLTTDRANSTIIIERCFGEGAFGYLIVDVWLTADDENVRASAQLWLNESDTCPNFDRKGYSLLPELAIKPNTSRDGIKMTARNTAENQPRDFVAVVFNLSHET